MNQYKPKTTPNNERGKDKDYKGFTSEEFNILLTTLSMVKGKFILSHFWNDQLREAVDKFRWNVVAIDSVMTVANNCRTTLRRKQELLVYNYDIIDLFHRI